MAFAGGEQTGITSTADSFPPPSTSAYNGDYVTITKPGKYTLERDIEHVNKAGLLISASSVYLDGMGHTVTPAKGGSDTEHIGVLILETDGSGEPVQGVTITNFTVTGENTGIIIGESGNSGLKTGDTFGSVNVRNLTLTNNRDGIILATRVFACGIEENRILNNTGTGLLISGINTTVTGNTITGNTRGITLNKADHTSITGNVISGNKEAGLIGEDAVASLITNNIVMNTENVLLKGDNNEYLFSIEPVNKTNIVGGPFLGGNAWGNPDIGIYLPSGGTDADGNGIFDEPYIITQEVQDQHPLVWSGQDSMMDATTIRVYVPLAMITPAAPPVQVQQTLSPTPVPTVNLPKSTISGLHARIIGDTIPETLQRGTKADVTIILYNDGTEAWYGADAIGVQAKDSAAKFGPAWISIPKDAHLESKQEVTIPFTLTALKEPGTYELVYYAGKQKEGLAVTFGRAYKKEITIT